MRIKPASGLKVRDPVTRLHIPEDGIDVPDVDGVPDPHWQFMLRHKDVVVVEPEQPPSQEAAPLPAPSASAPDHDALGPEQ